MHILSPMSKNLFHRAIVMSGSVLSLNFFDPPVHASAAATGLAGCLGKILDIIQSTRAFIMLKTLFQESKIKFFFNFSLLFDIHV